MADAPFTTQAQHKSPPTPQPQREQPHGSAPIDQSTPFANLSANPGPMAPPAPAVPARVAEQRPFKNLSGG